MENNVFRNFSYLRDEMEKKMKVGVIGSGRIGKVHMLSLKQVAQIEIKAVSDPYIDEEFAKDLEIPVTSKDHKVIMEDKEIQAVLICSPTPTHSTLMQEAAINRKHIFCEKPVDLDVKQVMKTLDFIDENEVFFQIGFNRRFDHNFLALKEQIKQNKIGKILSTTITSRDPAPPSLQYMGESGGIFKDMTIHDFDMLRFLTSKEVSTVYVQADVFGDGAIKNVPDFDSANITLTMEDGSLAFIHNSREASYGYDQRAEILGESGLLFSHNDRKSKVMSENHEAKHSQKPKHFFLDRYMQAYIKEIKTFAHCIQTNTPPELGRDDALEPLFIAEACLLSATESRVVSIKEIKQSYGVQS